MKSKCVKSFTQENKSKTFAIFWVMCLGTAVLSFIGYGSMLPGMTGQIVAAIMAVVTLVGLYLFHSTIMQAMTDNVPLRNRLAVLSTALLYFVFIIGLSSGINAAAISGISAQGTYLGDIAKRFTLATSKTFEQASSARKFLPLLEQESLGWAKAAEDELKHGAYSGFPEGGSVQLVLNNYSEKFKHLHEQTERFLVNAEQLNKKALKELGIIRLIIGKSLPPEKRMKSAAAHADILRSLLTQMQGKTLAESIAFSVESLPGEMKLITLSKNPRIARGQKQAINKIGQKLNGSIEILTRILGEYSAEKQPEYPAFEPMTTLRAVIVYWKAYPQAWLAGIGLDLLPIVIGIFLMQLDSGKSRADRARDEWMGLEVRHILGAKAAEESMRRINVDTELLNQFGQKELGIQGDNRDEN